MEVKSCVMKETQASGFEWLCASLIREELLSGGFVSELISNVLQPYLVNRMINHSVDFSPLFPGCLWLLYLVFCIFN